MISSNTAKQSFGKVLEAAQRGPVLIQKHNHPVAVLISIAEYDRLRSLPNGVLTEPTAAYSSKARPTAKTLPVIQPDDKTPPPHLDTQAMLHLVKTEERDTDA